VIVFSPGVIKLFGEHAVVYGKPAIAAAIDRGVRVKCSRSDRAVVRAGRAQVYVEYDVERREAKAIGEEGEKFLSYVLTALRIAEAELGPLKAVFELEGDFPPSVGAATSAATSVGVIRAYAACLGVGLEKEELAKLGHRVELEVQGAASPMDTAVSAIGGLLKITPSPFSYEKINPPMKELALVLLPRRGLTKDIVADVRALRSRHRSVDAVIDAIGEVVEEAWQCLKGGDLKCVGELMEVNNWLLGALGVVGDDVVALLRYLKPFIYGGKISGAGRGGVVVLLPKRGEIAEALAELGLPTYIVRIDELGARAL
jgi:mevalonate kinase